MIACPKCGFKNNQSQATDCPKCGLIYAKLQKAQENETRHISAEKALNDSLNQAITDTHQIPSDYTDFEPRKDSESYQMIGHLSFFLIGLSGVLAIFLIVEIKYFWGFLTEMNATFKPFSNTDIFSKSDTLLIILSITMVGIIQIALCLAIGGFLHLGKDIADNTRATKNYLAHLTNKSK